jgi:hypothetical protein
LIDEMGGSGKNGVKRWKTEGDSPQEVRLSIAEIICGGAALGTTRAKLADMTFPAAVAADEIHAVLELHFSFHEKGPVQFHEHVNADCGDEPGNQLAQRDIVEQDGIQCHGCLHRFFADEIGTPSLSAASRIS